LVTLIGADVSARAGTSPEELSAAQLLLNPPADWMMTSNDVDVDEDE